MQRSWFHSETYHKLDIIKYQSLADQHVQKTITIKDPMMVGLFVKRIEKIPAGGEMMKSFAGTAEHIQLVFYGEQGIQLIDIIQKRFKTPSTGFNIEKIAAETGLYQDIDALLFPAFHKSILKIQDLEILFPTFSIMYTGTEFQDFSPATVSVHTDRFVVKDKIGIQPLEIHSGQLPPQPKSFTVGQTSLRLLTYKTSQEGRLYPSHFCIEDE